MKRYITAAKYESYSDFVDNVDGIMWDAVDLAEAMLECKIGWGRYNGGIKFVLEMENRPVFTISFHQLQYDYNHGGIGAVANSIVWEFEHYEED